MLQNGGSNHLHFSVLQSQTLAVMSSEAVVSMLQSCADHQAAFTRPVWPFSSPQQVSFLMSQILPKTYLSLSNAVLPTPTLGLRHILSSCCKGSRATNPLLMRLHSCIHRQCLDLVGERIMSIVLFLCRSTRSSKSEQH